MIANDTRARTRLWTPDGFRQDEWRYADRADALAGNGRVILPLDIVLGLDDQTRISAKQRLGVVLLPGEPLDEIAGLLDRLSLVALAFPAFSDGRSFSKGELLRSRHRFEGAVRATGQVLPDQLPHMLRVGFDEFEISHPVLLERLESGESGGLKLAYQPTAKAAAKPGKYAWRRVVDDHDNGG